MAGVTYAATNDQDPDTGRSFTAAGNFTLAEMRSAAGHLDDIEAESSDRFIVVRALALQNLLEETEVTSSDFNTVKASPIISALRQMPGPLVPVIPIRPAKLAPRAIPIAEISSSAWTVLTPKFLYLAKPSSILDAGVMG